MSVNNKKKILSIGSYNVGLTCRTGRIPVWGETLIGSGFSESYGGKGSNQAVAAARLGGDVTFIGCLGKVLSNSLPELHLLRVILRLSFVIIEIRILNHRRHHHDLNKLFFAILSIPLAKTQGVYYEESQNYTRRENGDR
jgi:pfkB family carbohydrate kinase